MSQYTTDEVLEMMEKWYEDHKDDEDDDDEEFDDDEDPATRFWGFDGLMGADLRGIDLSDDTVRLEAEKFRQRSPDSADPPWIHQENWGSVAHMQGGPRVHCQ